MPLILDHKIGNSSLKKHLEHIRGMMRAERQEYDPHWKTISRYITPAQARFDPHHQRRTVPSWNDIINNTATTALRVAVSGMFAGNMSPARPWMALVHPDDNLMQREDVKVWLHQVEQIIFSVLRDSDFYKMCPMMLRSLVAFGVSAVTHVDDPVTTSRFYPHSIGSYYLGLDDALRPNQMLREFTLNVEQTVQKFGMTAVSSRVKEAYDRSNYKTQVGIVNYVGPNPIMDPGNLFARGKPYLSIYYEIGMGNAGLGGRPSSITESTSAMPGGEDAFLALEGFYERPFHAPRWWVEGEDTYASECPGMVALGDTKQLQVEERRKGQAIDKQTDPPLQAPPTIQNQGVTALPGGITYVSTGAEVGGGIKTLYDVNLNLQDLLLDMQHVEMRIKDAFYVPLFLAITEMDGIQPRNEFELINRNDEKLLQLGPVLQQVQGEFLSPVVNRVFNQLIRLDDDGRNGVLPPIPEALRGQPLEVRYISSLAQAQRAVATQAMDRVVDFTTRALQILSLIHISEPTRPY